MLQIDDDAVGPLAEMGPLRISAEEVDGEVEISISEATEPAAGDEVVERDGVRLFLDAMAAGVLDDQVIGVHAHEDHFHFSFAEQPAAD